MSYIFLDESGDLGFDLKKKGTSTFFIITFLFVAGVKSPFEKIVHKSHAELKKNIKRRVGVLHAVREKGITRQRILRRLVEKECSIMTIYLNKNKVFTKLQDEKEVLYNYVANILLDRIYTKKIIDPSDPIELIASRRETNKFLNENFKQYLQNQVRNNHQATIKVTIKTPDQEKVLQLVDFISWALFRKYEYQEDDYYAIIKPKMVEESHLFP